ncbi:MAG TPA: choice-of-anchor tandem repeat NxxGxxAF-containing protein [Candidatus Polarisedimenticolaceae bacterium]|nr:choice-of-anchor tandem repeat NxxGxxAF-containing protein [Candidatus Polarisedimenticolaceae bacterium]
MKRFRASSWIIPVVVTSLTSPSTASAPTLAVVALSGQQAAGAPPGTTFSTFGSASFDGAPAVGSDSTVAFAAILSDATMGFWLDHGSGPELLALSGSPAPGTEPGVVFSQRVSEAPLVTPPLLAPGYAVFANTLRGPGIGFNNDEGIWRFDGSGLVLVAREGASVPGLSGVQFTGLVPRALDGAGRAVVFSTLAGAVVEGNNASLWRATPGAGLELLVREGDAAPGAGFGVVFSAPSGPAAFLTTSNTGGDLLFQTSVHGPGTSDTNDEALYIRDAAGTRLFLREGSPVPGLTGFVFGNGTGAGFDGAVSFSDGGSVALTANITNGTATATAMLSDRTGSLGVLIRSGDPAPAGDGSFDLLGRPFMNSGGEIAFLASTTSSATRLGLWRHGAGGLRALALPGQPVPGQLDGPSFDTVQSIQGFNDDGFVLFTAILLAPNGFGSTALLLADPAGNLGVLARTGATLTVTGGDLRTVSEIAVRLDALSGDSHIAFGVRFTDGSGAEFRAFAETQEVTNVQVSRSTVTWDAVTDQDAGTLYQVVRGSLAALPVGSLPGTETCLAEETSTSVVEATVPASRSGFWYLVRAKHSGGTGTYGYARQDGVPAAERVSEACP